MAEKLTKEQKKQKKLEMKKNLEELNRNAIMDQVLVMKQKDFKQKYKEKIQKHYKDMVLKEYLMFFPTLFSFVPVLGWIFLYGPVSYGKTKYYQNMLQNDSATVRDLFSGFSKRNYWKSVLCGAIKWLYLVLWCILLVVPAIVKDFQYMFIFQASLNYAELSAHDCLNRSMGLSKGNRGIYFKWNLPFYGYYLLSLCSATLCMPFISPYYNGYKNAYYLEIENKLKEYKPSSEYLIEVRNMKKYFPLEKSFFGKPTLYLRAVDDVSIHIKKGQTLGIVGESGCGKTTLGRTLIGLYDMTSGSVYYDGKNIGMLQGSEFNKLRTEIQIIFQDPYSSLSPRLPIGEIIAEGVRAHHVVPKNETRSYVMSIMKKCGLQPQYYDRYPHEFSGGQRQRICIARALAVNPKFVVCDEPVSALDVSIQAQIINLLKDLQNEMGLTYLFISHDLSVVEHISDYVGVMYLGSMVENGPKEKIFANPLHPYTQALLSAVPVPDPDAKMERIVLEGDIPSPANPPKGCKFHTRCKYCMDICKKETPVYKEYEPEHFCACHLYEMNKDEK